MAKLAKPARIIAVMGDSGSGKSAYVKQQLARVLKPKRRLVWDFKREYRDGKIFTELSKLLDAMEQGEFSLIFHPSMDSKLRAQQFDIVCRAVVDVGRVCFLVEELAFVTTAQRSPDGWSLVTLTGRHDNLTVIGTSQRPASIDKNFLANATVIHTGCLGYVEDEKAVAKVMRIDPDEIHALKPLEWIEYHKATKNISRGKLSFS